MDVLKHRQSLVMGDCLAIMDHLSMEITPTRIVPIVHC